MFVVIAGGGRTGTQLARLLLQQDHEVRVIDERREILMHIHKELPTEAVYEGSPLDMDVLERAGIHQAQVFAAVTTSDELNLSLCYLARSKYNVLRTIARVNNPRNAWLFDKKFNVDVTVNQAEIISRMIEEEMSMGDMVMLLKLRRGNYSLVEEKIPAGAPALGKAIKDIHFPERCVIAAIIRHGEVIVPRGVTMFEVGDEVLAVADSEGALQLEELFTPAGQEHPIKNHNNHNHNNGNHA